MSARLSSLWSREMVDLLKEQRDAGITSFPLAWDRAQALATYCRAGDSFGEFFRRACQREWEGHVRVDYAGLADVARSLGELEHPLSPRGPVLLGRTLGCCRWARSGL
jgi:hypothetical protein